MVYRNKQKTKRMVRLAALGTAVTMAAFSGLTTSAIAQDTSQESVSATGETGQTTVRGYPVVTLPPGTDPEDENWVGIDLTPKPPVLPKDPEQELHHLIPPQGFDLELIASEPTVEEPAAIAFDGNGRMYVVELRTYMQDADATGETAREGRISRLEDTDNDGIYDHHTVFIDSLVFPRFVLPFGANTVLAMESHEDVVYKYIDTDEDGRSDVREVFATGFGRSGNVEHQQSFLTWAMDNWLYATYQSTRLRWTPDGVLKEPTASPGGAWGVTQDDYGKTWVQGGASGMPGYFQFPVVYDLGSDDDFEDLETFSQYEEGMDIPYGAPIKIADMQGGMDQVRMPDGSLNDVTAGAGNDIFRGHRLPEDMRGDYFYGEAVARIVRRIRPEKVEGLTRLRNLYQDQQTEFIRATDPLFRPVDMATAPDGTMYIVDMYRGIIQQGNWTQPGDYLRVKIEQYQLDKVFRHGRIWRLTHESMERDTTRPRMLDETPAQLVEHLDHPNGWWRDKAQQLLVLSQDRSVVPALREMVDNSANELARFHALWTLEGLGALEASRVRELMEDSNPQMRLQAIRVSETLYKYGDNSFESEYRALTGDENVDVAIQALLTLHLFNVEDLESIVADMQASRDALGIQLVGNMILQQRSEEQQLASAGLTPMQLELYENGSTIYANLCSECHGSAGLGTPVGEPGGPTIAPPIAGADRIQGHRDYLIKTLLHGMTGPIQGIQYAGSIMAPMGSNTDEWVASVVSYIRNSMGNSASFVTPEDVAEVRAETSTRTTPYTYQELMSEVPQILQPDPAWEVTASHSAPTGVGSAGDPAMAFNFDGWTTGSHQEPGMWFQIEIPEPVSLSEIKFNSSEARGTDAMTYPRGIVLEVSNDGDSWRQMAQGQGEDITSTTAWEEDEYTTTTLSFDPVQARFIRLTQTAEVPEDPENPAPWSIDMLELYGNRLSSDEPGR